MSAYTKIATKGNTFVLTQKGYDYTKTRPNAEELLKEREVGKPVGEYTEAVPALWLDKGWVEEAKRS